MFFNQKKEYKKIGVSILGPLGDVINTTGVFAQLRKAYPDAEISVITVPRGLPATKGIPEISHRYVYERIKGKNDFFKMIKFGTSLIGKFDLMVVLDNHFRSAFISLCSLTPKRIGRSGQGRKLILTDTIPHSEEEKIGDIPVAEHYARCLKPLGIYKENLKTCYGYSKEDNTFANSLIEKNNLCGQKILGICPACFHEFKTMNVSDVARFIELINEKTSYKVAIVGGSDVCFYVENLQKECKAPFVSLVGQTSFEQTACFIEKCSKFISVDTACLHLAVAVSTPVVAIFYRNIAQKWGPADLNYNRLIVNLENKLVEPEQLFENIMEMTDKDTM